MRLLFLLVLIPLLGLKLVTAQGFAPDGAMWHYDNWQAITFYGDGYVLVMNDGDTLIEGRACQRLKIVTYSYDAFLLSNDTIESFEYVFSKNDSVFNYRFGSFYLLYDFGALPNDTWQVAGNDVCNQAGTVFVDSVGVENVNGEQLRWVSVSSPPASPVQFSNSKIYEKIGCSGYMFPEPFCVTDSDIGGALRCYSEPDFSYIKEFNTDCDAISFVSVAESQKAELWDVYPTNFNETLRVRGSKHTEMVEFQLLDMSGQIIMRKKISIPHDLNELGLLSNGTYITRILTENRIYSQIINKIR